MIIIANRGACPRRAIELIGHTSKDGITTVGRFGSGTAYAVALALRQNLLITISSHDEDGPYEVQPYIKEVTIGPLKARQVMWRYRRGSSLFRSWWETPLKALSRAWSVPTSFSVELGHKDWHGAFPVVREFVNNARDADPEHFVCWVNDDANETHLEMYLSRAKLEGHSAVTVVRIENPYDNADAPEHYIENWSDNFRWEPYHNGDTCGEIYRDGLAAIYKKPELSALKMFVRGVRCPWPGDAPSSRYDYSLNLDLTEARTVKSEGYAATAMTMLWVGAPRELLADMLKRIPELPGGCWEAGNFNEWVQTYDSDKPVVQAWRDAYGDAPVAGPSDLVVPGAISVTQPMRDLLARNGVPTAQSRVAVVEYTESNGGISSVATAPSAVERVVIELKMTEAHRLLRLLQEHPDPVLEDLTDKLIRAGANPDAA